MPRVPQYEGPQVRPTPLRAEQNIRAPAGAFGADVGQALSQAGQQVGQVASLLDRRAEEHLKQDAETEAFKTFTSAASTARQLMWEGDGAIFNRRGENSMGSTKEATVELRKIGEDHAGGLSPYAKEQFERRWSQHQESELGSVSRHEAGQRREYQDQALAGTLKVYNDQAALYFNDPTKIQQSIDLGRSAIHTNPQGLPAEMLKARETEFTSGVHKAVVLRMATDNPLAANAYFKEHASEFTAEDASGLQRTLAPTVKRAEARVEGDKIIKEVTENRNAAPATLHSAVEEVESGGDGNAESGAGAKGVMQVLDSTGQEVAGKLGVPWQPELMKGTTPEAKAYQRKIGGAYLDQQLEKYGGNRVLALASYNAGPGMVDDWLAGTNKTGKNPELLKLPDPRTGEITDAAWAAKIPFKETKQYIARVEGKIRKGVQDNIDLTRTEEMVQERFPDDPDKQDAVTAHIHRQNALREQALRDRNTEAWKQGLSHIDNGGSVDNLPPDVLENLAPGRLKDLEVREDSRIKGRDKPDNPAEYDRLMALSVTDPEAFIAEDPTKWALPKAQVTQLIGIKAARMTKEAKEEAKVNDTKKAISLTANLLRQAHIDPTPKDNDAKGAGVLSAYTAKMMERLDEFKQKEGRRATDAEVMAIGQELLLPGRLSVDWWPDKDVKAFEVTPDNAAKFYVPFDKIPANEKADIVAALGKRATNELVEQIYGAVKRGDKAMVQRLTAAETVPNPVN